MALARLALNNLKQRMLVTQSSSIFLGRPQKQMTWASHFVQGLSSAATENPEPAGAGEVTVAVAEGGMKPKPFPRRKNRGIWRNNNRYFIPHLWEYFPSGLGNAIMQATHTLNSLIENLSPSRLMGRAKEHDDFYNLRYELPGLGKKDVKITVHDGVLRIKGERKEEEEEGGCRSYEYYDTGVLLPDDAKIDGIKAEMKDGLLNVVIPRKEREKKDAMDIQVD